MFYRIRTLELQTCCTMLRRFETRKGSQIRSNRCSFVLFTSMLASHTVSVCCREISSVKLVCEHVPKLSDDPPGVMRAPRHHSPRWLCDIRIVRVNISNRHAHRANVGFHAMWLSSRVWSKQGDQPTVTVESQQVALFHLRCGDLRNRTVPLGHEECDGRRNFSRVPDLAGHRSKR